jgi:hypothetical protein
LQQRRRSADHVDVPVAAQLKAATTGEAVDRDASTTCRAKTAGYRHLDRDAILLQLPVTSILMNGADGQCDRESAKQAGADSAGDPKHPRRVG